MLWHCQGLSASFPLSGWTRRGSRLLVCEGWHPLSQSLKQAKGVAPLFILAPLFPRVVLEDTVTEVSHTPLMYGCRRLRWSLKTYTCLHTTLATPIFICGEGFWSAALKTFSFFVKSCLEGYLASIARDTMWLYSLGGMFVLHSLFFKVNSRMFYCP